MEAVYSLPANTTAKKNAAMQSIRGVCYLRLFIVLVDIIFVVFVFFVVLAFVEKRIISVIP